MAEKRENRITIRVSDSELRVLKDASKDDDRSVSSFVRVTVLKAAYSRMLGK